MNQVVLFRPSAASIRDRRVTRNSLGSVRDRRHRDGGDERGEMRETHGKKNLGIVSAQSNWGGSEICLRVRVVERAEPSRVRRWSRLARVYALDESKRAFAPWQSLDEVLTSGRGKETLARGFGNGNPSSGTHQNFPGLISRRYPGVAHETGRGATSGLRAHVREGQCTRVTGVLQSTRRLKCSHAAGSTTGNTGCSELDFDDKKGTPTI